MLYRLYGMVHKLAKRVLRRTVRSNSLVSFFYVHEESQLPISLSPTDTDFALNEKVYSKSVEVDNIEYLFKGENTIVGCRGPYINKERTPHDDYHAVSAEEAWKLMLQNASVGEGWRNSGYCLTGYIKEKKQWVLSSWIWTSAAACRYFAHIKDEVNVRRIADAFLRDQQTCGGWIVRFDYSQFGVVPILAPNDSAYIASNAMLTAFELTSDEKYLMSALKCADWIIDTACEDGLVLMGQNTLNGEWIKESNIVDTGFTAGLFAKLVEMHKSEKYMIFLKKFIDIYISVFWNETEGAFFTAIDGNRQPRGGYFARGQAWALEGLIPAYKVLGDERIKCIINRLVEYLCHNQRKNGAWPYNFSHPLMGLDCKGVSIIAKSLLQWYDIDDNKLLVESAYKAIEWCKKHTMLSGECVGGIFSYSVEGSVVHNFYTSTAFTYASAYALEVDDKLEKLKIKKIIGCK